MSFTSICTWGWMSASVGGPSNVIVDAVLLRRSLGALLHRLPELVLESLAR